MEGLYAGARQMITTKVDVSKTCGVCRSGYPAQDDPPEQNFQIGGTVSSGKIKNSFLNPISLRLRKYIFLKKIDPVKPQN